MLIVALAALKSGAQFGEFAIARVHRLFKEQETALKLVGETCDLCEASLDIVVVAI